MFYNIINIICNKEKKLNFTNLFFILFFALTVVLHITTNTNIQLFVGKYTHLCFAIYMIIECIQVKYFNKKIDKFDKIKNNIWFFATICLHFIDYSALHTINKGFIEYFYMYGMMTCIYLYIIIWIHNPYKSLQKKLLK